MSKHKKNGNWTVWKNILKMLLTFKNETAIAESCCWFSDF